MIVCVYECVYMYKCVNLYIYVYVFVELLKIGGAFEGII